MCLICLKKEIALNPLHCFKFWTIPFKKNIVKIDWNTAWLFEVQTRTAGRIGGSWVGTCRYTDGHSIDVCP